MNELEKQLKSLYGQMDSDERNKKIKKVAEYLMQNYCIEANKTQFFMNEIEFYLYCDGHRDPYIHCYDMKNKECRDNTNNKKNKESRNNTNNQGEMLQWYFHGSGMDITFGESGIGYGGILIRSIKSGDEEIRGPIRVRRKVFEYIDTDKEFNADKSQDCRDQLKKVELSAKKAPLELKIRQVERNKNIISLPRHGLNPIKEKYPFNFYCKPYRFIVK